MRILWDAESDDATLTASTEAPNLPVEYVQEPRLSMPWRSTAIDDQWILIDAGSGNTIEPDMVAIAGHNLTSGCTLKIQGNATDSWGGTPTIDETITHRDDIIVHVFTGAALRFWRLSIDDDANTDGYLQIGRLMLGTLLQLPYVEPGENLPRETTSVASESISGQAFGDRGIERRVPGFQFPAVTEAERQLLLTMWESVQNIDPVVLVVWEDSLTVEGPIYCRLDQAEIPFQLAREAGLLWTTTLKFREVF